MVFPIFIPTPSGGGGGDGYSSVAWFVGAIFGFIVASLAAAFLAWAFYDRLAWIDPLKVPFVVFFPLLMAVSAIVLSCLIGVMFAFGELFERLFGR